MLKFNTSRKTIRCLLFLVLVSLCQPGLAGPQEDRQAFADYFKARFPDIPFAEFANGIYAIDSDAREQWLDIETFPPYQFSVERGQALWDESFTDGSSYFDCFGNIESGIKQSFPHFDSDSGEVETLELAINRCRQTHQQAALEYGGDEMLSLTAYISFMSRGKTINVSVPEDDPRALDAYEDGKRFYYSKRGQLNFSCSDCHVTSVGHYIRADRLSASLGHPTHFPAYRSKTGGMVSLHQRFFGCVRDARARPFDLQSREFRNLEYFLSYMSNGLELNGPGARK
jgi:L-cysteine S-thiosulfotransferase